MSEERSLEENVTTLWAAERSKREKRELTKRLLKNIGSHDPLDYLVSQEEMQKLRWPFYDRDLDEKKSLKSPLPETTRLFGLDCEMILIDTQFLDATAFQFGTTQSDCDLLNFGGLPKFKSVVKDDPYYTKTYGPNRRLVPCRISIVDENSEIVYDSLIAPCVTSREGVVDYLTQFTGVGEAELWSPNPTLFEAISELRRRIINICDIFSSCAHSSEENIIDNSNGKLESSTVTKSSKLPILVGHSLADDFRAMGNLHHPFCLDTQLLYPHGSGAPPWVAPSKLKLNTELELGRVIQTSNISQDNISLNSCTNTAAAVVGHSSVEDAIAAKDLALKAIHCGRGRWVWEDIEDAEFGVEHFFPQDDEAFNNNILKRRATSILLQKLELPEEKVMAVFLRGSRAIGTAAERKFASDGVTQTDLPSDWDFGIVVKSEWEKEFRGATSLQTFLRDVPEEANCPSSSLNNNISAIEPDAPHPYGPVTFGAITATTTVTTATTVSSSSRVCLAEAIVHYGNLEAALYDESSFSRLLRENTIYVLEMVFDSRSVVAGSPRSVSPPKIWRDTTNGALRTSHLQFNPLALLSSVHREVGVAMRQANVRKQNLYQVAKKYFIAIRFLVFGIEFARSKGRSIGPLDAANGIYEKKFRANHLNLVNDLIQSVYDISPESGLKDDFLSGKFTYRTFKAKWGIVVKNFLGELNRLLGNAKKDEDINIARNPKECDNNLEQIEIPGRRSPLLPAFDLLNGLDNLNTDLLISESSHDPRHPQHHHPLETVNFLRRETAKKLQEEKRLEDKEKICRATDAALHLLTATHHVLARRHMGSLFPNLVQLHYALPKSGKKVWNWKLHGAKKSTVPFRIPWECRGLILDQTNNWEVVAYPYAKFFDFGEAIEGTGEFANFEADAKDEGDVTARQDDDVKPPSVEDTIVCINNAFSRCEHIVGASTSTNMNNCYILPKMDGCFAMLYHYKDAWHVASSTLPDACGELGWSSNMIATANAERTSFATIFWRIWEKRGYKLPPKGMTTNSSNCKWEDYCFFFELLSRKHAIVCRPLEDDIILHGCRNVKTLNEVNIFEDDIMLKCWNNVKRVQPIGVNNIFGSPPHVRFLELLQTYAATLDPEKNEGFVVVLAEEGSSPSSRSTSKFAINNNNFYRLKVKSPRYCELSWTYELAYERESEISLRGGSMRSRLVKALLPSLVDSSSSINLININTQTEPALKRVVWAARNPVAKRLLEQIEEDWNVLQSFLARSFGEISRRCQRNDSPSYARKAFTREAYIFLMEFFLENDNRTNEEDSKSSFQKKKSSKEARKIKDFVVSEEGLNVDSSLAIRDYVAGRFGEKKVPEDDGSLSLVSDEGILRSAFSSSKFWINFMFALYDAAQIKMHAWEAALLRIRDY